MTEIQMKVQRQLAKAVGSWKKTEVVCDPEGINFKKGKKRFLWTVLGYNGFSVGDKCALNTNIMPWRSERETGARVNQPTYRIAGFVEITACSDNTGGDETIEHNDIFCALAQEPKSFFSDFSIYGSERNGVILYWIGEIYKIK